MVSKISIAIVEDCPIQYKIMEGFIKRASNLDIIYHAQNGYDLLHLLKTFKVVPDVCVLDLEMPVMNGIVTAGHLSKKFPSIKIFGCTSCNDEVLKNEMLKNGALAIFSKSKRQDLINMLTKLPAKPL